MNPTGDSRLFSQPKRWTAIPIVLACFVPAPVWADPSESVTHAMQWEEGQTIHIANQGGAINRHRNVKLAVELSSSSKALVTESGTRSEHNLYRDYSSDDTTKWLNIWQGTWSLAGDVMRLSLTLQDRKCTHQKKWSDAAPETLPCGTVSKHLALSCTLSQVTPEGASGPSSAGASVPVWICSPSAPAELADLPSRWVLGKASCIKVLAGHKGFTYQRCARP
jgi:hypothetical protein